MSLKVLLTTLNASYIHKNLALRWIYQSCPDQREVWLKEFTIREDETRIIEQICEGHYDIICFSIYIWNITQSMTIIRALKQRQKDLVVL